MIKQMKHSFGQPRRLKSASYQRIITDHVDVPIETMRGLFLELLDHLDMELIVEETPDYTAFEIRKKEEAT